MNILFICDEYPPGKNGGIGTVVQVLGRELAKQGHKVLVVGLYSFGYGEKEYEEDQGVRVWRMRYGYNLGNGNGLAYKFFNKIPGSIRQHLNGRKAFAGFITFIHGLIAREKIGIIELPDWNTFAMHIGFTVNWPAFAAPLVVKSHGNYTKLCYDLGRKPKPEWAILDQLLYKRADALVAVSRDTANINRKLLGPALPIHVLYNGIELPAELSAAPRISNRVIYTGSLTKAKGIYALTGAWKKVLTRMPDAQLHVFGKGDTSPLLSLLTATEQKSVTFHGHVPRPVLRQQLQTAALSVFPSYSEAFGLGVVEAMSEGCPVIYTQRSCGPEIVEHMKEGLLVDSDREEEIADAILLLLANPPLREEMSRKAYEKVKKTFNSVSIARQHVDWYQSIISGQPAQESIS